MPGCITPPPITKYSRIEWDGVPSTSKLDVVWSLVHDMMNQRRHQNVLCDKRPKPPQLVETSKHIIRCIVENCLDHQIVATCAYRLGKNHSKAWPWPSSGKGQHDLWVANVRCYPRSSHNRNRPINMSKPWFCRHGYRKGNVLVDAVTCIPVVLAFHEHVQFQTRNNFRNLYFQIHLLICVRWFPYSVVRMPQFLTVLNHIISWLSKSRSNPPTPALAAAGVGVARAEEIVAGWWIARAHTRRPDGVHSCN